MAMRLNWLDRSIGVFAPRAALRRGAARATLDGLRGYDGASIGRRTDGWRTPKTSADAEIYKSLAMLRNRSRDLSRNNAYARKAKSVWVGNLVGTGIWPRSPNKQANDLFKRWAQQCDADGQLDFAGLQKQMVGEMVEAGEVLVRRRLRRPEDNLPVPLQLQLVEGDLLDETRTQDLGALGKIVNGVEINPIGQRSAYWLFADHPGNFPIASGNVRSAPVPASEIAHLYDRERSQVRGVPWCAPIILPVRDLADYNDAERVRKKSEACVVGFVTDAAGVDPAEGGGAPTVTARGGAPVTDFAGNPVEQFQPGLIAYVQPGRDIKFNNPTQSDSGVQFLKLGLHEVAAGYRVPYELLTGDLSEVNFTSFRAGNNEFQTLVEMAQWLSLIPMALNVIWDWFCEAAYIVGKTSQRFIPVEWDTPVFKSVQPLDDVNADLFAVRAGFDSLFSVIGRRTGRNPVEVLEEIAASNRELDRLGLILDCDPRQVTRAGVEQIASSSSQPPPAKPRIAAVA
jgi:lambda family phage portal protein